MFDPITLRHELHQIPEPSFQEFMTRDLLKAQLAELLFTSGVQDLFELHEFANSTGLLISFRGGAPELPFRLFRADMDALPSEEATQAPFTSKHPGMMHACGHDVHMAVLMGLIQRVWIKRPRQNLLFLFQPAEEGEGGALSVLAEGLIQQYNVEAVFALHVASSMPVGTISSKAGIFFGIPQEFDLRFFGKAAHVAFPEQGVNALACAVDFFSSIQADLQKLMDEERVIFHVGKMQAGRIRNIIADSCTLEGTHRSLNKSARESLNQLIDKHAGLCAEAIGATYELKLLNSYDPVVNNAVLVEELQRVCAQCRYTFTEAETVMTGEDFGFFTSIYPGLLFWLGSGNEHPLHSREFLPSDDCIKVGIDVFWALL